jgi:hypothetical protein
MRKYRPRPIKIGNTADSFSEYPLMPDYVKIGL